MIFTRNSKFYFLSILTALILIQSTLSVTSSIYGYKGISASLSLAIDETTDDIFIKLSCSTTYRYKIFPIDSNLFCKTTDSKYKQGYCSSVYNSGTNTVSTFIPPMPEAASSPTSTRTCSFVIQKRSLAIYTDLSTPISITYDPDYTTNLINIFPSQAIVTSKVSFEMNVNLTTTTVSLQKISIGDYSMTISNSNVTTVLPDKVYFYVVLRVSSFYDFSHYLTGEKMKPGFYRDIYVQTSHGLSYYTASTSILYTNDSGSLDYWDLEIIGYITNTKALTDSGSTFQGLENGNQLLEVTGYLGTSTDPLNIYIGNSNDSTVNYCTELSRTMLTGGNSGKMTVICQTTALDKSASSLELPPRGGKVTAGSGDLSSNLNKLYMNFGEMTSATTSTDSYQTISGVFCPTSTTNPYRFISNFDKWDFIKYTISGSMVQEDFNDYTMGHYPYNYFDTKYSSTSFGTYAINGWVNFTSSSCEPISMRIYYEGSMDYARLSYEYCDDTNSTACNNTSASVSSTLDNNKAWQIYTFNVSSTSGSITVSCTGFTSKVISYTLDDVIREKHFMLLLYFAFKDMGIITDDDAEDNELRFLSYFQIRATKRATNRYDYVIEVNYYKKISFSCNSGCTVTVMKQFNHNLSRRFVDSELIRMDGFDFSNTLYRQLLVYYSDTINEKNRATCESGECMFLAQDANYYPIITNVNITYVSNDASTLVLKYVITTTDFANYNNSDNDTYIVIGNNSIQEGISNTTFQYSSGVFTIEEVSFGLVNTIQYPQIITKYGSLKVTSNLYDCDANSTQGTTTKSVSISSVNLSIDVSYCTCTNGLFGNDVSCLISTNEQLKYKLITTSTSVYVLCDVSEYAWEGTCLTECLIYTEITVFTYNTLDYNYCMLCTGSQMALRNACVDVCDRVYEIAHNNSCSCNYCNPCEGSKPFEYEYICYNQCPVHTSHDSGSYECYLCPNLYDINSMKCLSECYPGYYYEGTICYLCDPSAPFSFHNNCYSECPQGTKIDTVTNSSCTNCEFYYDLISKICVEECTKSQITDKTNKECVTCTEPEIYRDMDTYSCVEKCPIGYITNYDELKCVSAGDKYIYNNDIVKTCPKYYIANEDTRLCTICDENYKKYQDGVCVENCNTSTAYLIYSYEDQKISICLNCTGFLNLETSNELLNISDDLSNISLDYVPECSETCLLGATLFSTGKYCYEKSTIISSSDSTNTDTSSSVDDNSDIICESGYEKTLENSIYKCKSCRNLNKYNQNGICVSICGSEYTANTSTMQCSYCGEGEYSQESGSSYSCVSTCDSSLGYYIDSTVLNTCTDCISKGMFIDNKKCVSKCGNGKTADSSGKCISCEDSNLPYIIDGECKVSCPDNYRIISYQGKNNICSYYAKDPTCKDDNPCKNNSTCYIKNTGDLACNCTTAVYTIDDISYNYFGSNCTYNESDIVSLSNIVSTSSSRVTKLSSSSSQLSESDLDEVSSIKEIIQDAPELITTELVESLVDLVSKQLSFKKDTTSLTTQTIALLDLVDTAFSAVSSTSNSSVSVSEVKIAIKSMISSILLAQSNITDFISSTGSSVLYSGSSFSIQVSDNSEQSLSEAREKGLSIVDYDKCEETLKESGILDDDDSLYALNISYDTSLLDDKSKTSSSISTSSSLTTILVNSEGEEVDTSSCKSIQVKSPVNNNIVDTESQSEISNEIGVDVYDSTETFFSDRCFPYGTNGTDTTLSSRRNTYNVTATCSEGCTYEGVDEHSYVICDCEEVPTESTTTFETSVFGALLNSNFMLITCFSTVINANLLKDLGFWAVSVITLIVIIITIGHAIIFNIKLNLAKIVYYDAVTITPDKVGASTKSRIEANNKVIKSNKHNYNIQIIDNNSKNMSIDDIQVFSKVSDKETNISYNIIENNISSNSNSLKSSLKSINNGSQYLSINNDINYISQNNMVLSPDKIRMINNNSSSCNRISVNNTNIENHKDLSQVTSNVIPFKVGVKNVTNTLETNLHKYNINRSNDQNMIINDSSNSGNNSKRNIDKKDNNNLNEITNININNSVVHDSINGNISNNTLYKKIEVNNLSKLHNNLVPTIAVKAGDKLTRSLNDNKDANKDNCKEKESNRSESDDKIIKKHSVKKLRTKRDMEVISPIEALVLDTRSFWRYFWDNLKETHPYLNIIYIPSVLRPFYIRFLGIMFSISLEFAMNAMFFTDSYIDEQASVKNTKGSDSTGFMYTLLNEFSKSLWPIVITIIISTITSLIIRIPLRYKNEVNENLIFHDEKVQLEGIKKFNKQMKCRYISYIILVFLIHLFCWYFVMAFCSVYINSNHGWLYGALISLGLDCFIIKPGFSSLKSLIRLIALRFPNKFTIKIYSLFTKLIELIG